MKRNLFALTVICCVVFACGPAKHEIETKEQAKQDSVVALNGFVSSSAAVENKKDTTRKFIRTADVKCKVKSVINSTVIIEDFAIQQNGFVTLSNLTQDVSRHTIIPISQDSSLETTYYVAKNDLIIRVPNIKLDTFLKQVATQIEFLDYRIIKANDVGLQVLENKITQQRIKKHEERLTKAIDEKAKKLIETSLAEENVLNKQEQADNAMISNLSLNDQINYSTVSIQLYQKETIKRELVENEKNTKAYEPGLWKKTTEALISGWYIFEALLLFLVNAWAFLLIGLILYLVYRRYRKS
ncbi:MAG TPA: DUF4349 domain-containing protein [Bacteroidia bacterium]|jgi:hypothetical protein|nr:DUF4349 domain-containing protein [Bacteroidia bacterium]